MNVGSLLVADSKSAKLIKPSKSPLDDPNAICRGRCRAPCCASQAREECRVHADLAGFTACHSPGRLARNPDESVDARAHLAMVGWRRQVPELPLSRYDWLR
jgi:hypothetical protein